MEWADLHLHSNWSDGSQSVEEIFREAARKGINCLSITDHDTVEGTQEALYWGQKLGIRAVPGIEISAYDYHSKKRVHLLGYQYRLDARHIREICDPLLKKRHENTLEQIKILSGAGYPLTENEVRIAAGNSPILYKQHIMKVFMKKRLTGDFYGELYRDLFKNDGIAQLDIEYIDVYDALEAIIQDGGLPVLAHPGLQNSYHLMDLLSEKGLWGVELFHEGNNLDDRIRISSLAEQLGLQLTGGSDSHGSLGSYHHVGDITAPKSLSWPDSRKLPERMLIAKELVEEAADWLREITLVDQDKEYKGGDPTDLVTQYDRNIEELLERGIRNHYPADDYITEEKDRGGVFPLGHVWIIDPIDGTTNFVQRRKDYSISVACYLDGKPLFGIVYDVMGRQLFEAVAGQGAWQNGYPMPGISTRHRLKESLVDFSLNTLSLFWNRYQVDITDLALKIRGHRAYGSASLILCKIARGETDMYISAKLSIWDHAAASIILEENGGRCFQGPPLEPSKGCRSPHFYIGATHSGLLEDLQNYLQTRGLIIEEEALWHN